MGQQAARTEPAGRDGASSARQRAEEAILDAFERVVARDGFRGLGPTAIMNEAGLGKPLLYRYFGDLPGLIEAWGERRGMWPGDATFLGSLSADQDPAEQLKASLGALAAHLHRNPVRLEILAEELTPDTSISPLLSRIRQGRQSGHERLFPPDHPLRRRENFRLNHVLFAALTYFALRSRTAPRLQGIDLDSEEGWEDTLRMIYEIIDDARLAAQFRRLLALAGNETSITGSDPGGES